MTQLETFTQTSRAGTSSAPRRLARDRDKARRGTARSAGRFCPRRGNSRAQASAVLAPPSALDALGAFGGDHLVQRAPPAEAQRRPVRHFGDRLDRLRPQQQPQRARRQIGFGADIGGTPPSRHRRRSSAPARSQPRSRGYGCPARSAGARAWPPSRALRRSTSRSSCGCLRRAADADLLGRAGLGDQRPTAAPCRSRSRGRARRRAPPAARQTARGYRLGSRNGREHAGGDAAQRAVGAE